MARLSDVRGAAPDDYRRLDSRLHLAIAEVAGSPSLVPLVAEIRMRLNELLDEIPLLPRNIAHSDEQHEAIVVAILAGDGTAQRKPCGHTSRVRRPCCMASSTSELPRACVSAFRHAAREQHFAHAREN